MQGKPGRVSLARTIKGRLRRPGLRSKTAVTKKKIPAKYEAFIHAAGMVLLLSFMAFVTFKDIWKLFT